MSLVIASIAATVVVIKVGMRLSSRVKVVTRAQERAKGERWLEQVCDVEEDDPPNDDNANDGHFAREIPTRDGDNEQEHPEQELARSQSQSHRHRQAKWKPLEEWKDRYEPTKEPKTESERVARVKVMAAERTKKVVLHKLQDNTRAKVISIVMEMSSRMLEQAEQTLTNKSQKMKKKMEKKMENTDPNDNDAAIAAAAAALEVSLLAPEALNSMNGIVLTYRFQTERKRHKFKYLRRVACGQLADLLQEGLFLEDEEKDSASKEEKVQELKSQITEVIEARQAETLEQMEEKLDELLVSVGTNIRGRIEKKVEQNIEKVNVVKSVMKGDKSVNDLIAVVEPEVRARVDKKVKKHKVKVTMAKSALEKAGVANTLTAEQMNEKFESIKEKTLETDIRASIESKMEQSKDKVKNALEKAGVAPPTAEQEERIRNEIKEKVGVVQDKVNTAKTALEQNVGVTTNTPTVVDDQQEENEKQSLMESDIRGSIESKMEEHSDKVDKAKAVLEQAMDQSEQIREEAKEKLDGFVKDKKMDELTVAAETEIRGRVESKMEEHADKVDKAKAVKEKFDGFVKDKKMDELTVVAETEIRGRVESKMEKHEDKLNMAKSVMEKVGSAIPTTVDQEAQIRQQMKDKFGGFMKSLIFDKMKNLVEQVIKTIDQVLDVAVQANDRIRTQVDSNPDDLRDEIYKTIDDMYTQMDKRIALEVQGVIGVLGGIMQASENDDDDDEDEDSED
eukprot:CAMPEP_0198281598 /NCGR_PEP_ID=MMETSP1449-20131203/1514_1 /TAXON_ID=420275 /ORGANISM="Attheya septentrionalis, Strain CCMP2084" /LENGTH=734 /DNA_ID=CAMNT_0043977449 /DNA_START=218 /DNA_END=2422 /DNA_ORIENTATION=-